MGSKVWLQAAVLTSLAGALQAGENPGPAEAIAKLRQLGCWVKVEKTAQGKSEVSVAGVMSPNEEAIYPLLPRCGAVVSLDLRNGFKSELSHWLSRLTSLRSLDLSANTLQFQSLKFLRSLKHLESLNISSHAPGSLEGLKSLQSLKKLRSLNLGCRSLRSAALRYLKGLDNLEELDLQGTKITNEGLLYLLELPKLRKLNLTYAALQPGCLEILAKMKTLEEVHLDHPLKKAFKDRDLIALQRLPRLRCLTLRETGITGKGLKHLVRLPQLRELSLSLNGIQAHLIQDGPNPERKIQFVPLIGLRDLRLLSRFPALESLKLDSFSVSPEVMRELARIPGLRKLDVGAIWLSEEELKPLAKMKRLEEIHFSSLGFSQKTFDRLHSAPSLKKVHLRLTGKDEDLKRLQKLQPLCSLNLEGSTITDQGLRHLKALTGLKWLSLRSTPITDEALKHVGRMSSLRSLCLAGAAVTDKGLLHLKRLTGLKKIDWTMAPMLTEGGKRRLLLLLPLLQEEQRFSQTGVISTPELQQ